MYSIIKEIAGYPVFPLFGTSIKTGAINARIGLLTPKENIYIYFN
jgi:hypothetical protein